MSRWSLAGTATLAAAILLASPLAAQDTARGRVLYQQWCAGCHGETGAGDGEAAHYMWPHPRDFTRALFQIRTTESGDLPTDDDLRRVIDVGMPGTAMPAWRSKFRPADRDAIVAYLKTFSRFFAGQTPTPLEFGSAPGGPSDEDLAEGRRVFVDELECVKCHGQRGRGDGPSAPTLSDDWDVPIRPADLTMNWTFNGGGTVEDIYRRLRTGLDGTPMPSFSDVLASNVITDAQLWQAAQYVRSLSPADPPRPRDVVRAALVPAGGLPAGPEDSAWAAVEEYYIPLVGQVVKRPRWFTPSVAALWVKAAHDGERLVLRLRWDDRTESPDPEWDEFFQLTMAALTDADGALPSAQGPDRVAVQFPVRLPEGPELPFFLGGDAQRKTSDIVWTSAPDAASVGTATGLGTWAPGGAVEHAAAFLDGEWLLQIERPLASSDTTVMPDLPEGLPIPMAFQVADGSLGEGAVRGAVSAWYAVYLDVPTPARVYVQPIVAGLLTAGLGLIVVIRAQRRGRAKGDTVEGV